MNKNLIIRQSNQALAFGEQYADALEALQTELIPFASELVELTKTDVEFQAIQERFKRLYLRMQALDK
ncbi:MAG: hypothetical protein ACOH2V_00785 [Candidatus Saccharimonadaceae bacterium]